MPSLKKENGIGKTEIKKKHMEEVEGMQFNKESSEEVDELL